MLIIIDPPVRNLSIQLIISFEKCIRVEFLFSERLLLVEIEISNIFGWELAQSYLHFLLVLLILNRVKYLIILWGFALISTIRIDWRSMVRLKIFLSIFGRTIRFLPRQRGSIIEFFLVAQFEILMSTYTLFIHKASEQLSQFPHILLPFRVRPQH